MVGVIGGSGGMYIIPAVLQVFLNHFVLGMNPLDAVQSPRVYHKVLSFASFNILVLNFTLLLSMVQRQGRFSTKNLPGRLRLSPLLVKIVSLNYEIKESHIATSLT